jgi:hypothetical protein
MIPVPSDNRSWYIIGYLLDTVKSMHGIKPPSFLTEKREIGKKFAF